MAFNCKCHRAGRLASRQVKGGWCNQCGQLNGHQKTREKGAENKIIWHQAQKKGARSKQEKIRN